MSSLAKQLKRLRIPGDTSSLERATKYKKRTSFLFDPKEACDIDNETVFALALNGLEELKLVNAHFEDFEALLFNESSKHLERSLQTQEVNDKLDKDLKEYLQFLSPYILLKPAHKTLEWLIRRFQIQLYNVDDLLACVFPYHQSNVFARVVQLINVSDSKWSWLAAVQKTGSPLPRSTIINHCLSNPGFFPFISGLVFNVVKSKTRAGQSLAAFHAFSSFYASTVIGVLENLNKVSEEILGTLLINIIHGLKSNVNDLQAASYMIIGQLCKKCFLESSVIKSLLKTICKTSTVQLSESVLMCINCLCVTQHLTEFPKVAFQSLCKLPNLATLLCELSKSCQMDSFFKLFIPHLTKHTLSSVLDGKESKEHDTEKLDSVLLLEVLKHADINNTVQIDIASNMLCEYIATRRACCNMAEDNVVIKLNNIVKKISRVIQNRWQFQMDKAVQDYLVSLRTEDLTEKESQQSLQWTQEFVFMSLSSVGCQVLCDSGSTLVVALHHPEAEFRKLALKSVSDLLKEPMKSLEDVEFLKESLLVKLSDEDPSVVSTLLMLPEVLVNVCHGEQLVTALMTLLQKSSRKWKDVFEPALDVLLSEDLLKRIPELTEHVLFYLLPLMFLRKKHVDRTKLVVDRVAKSTLGSDWFVKTLQKKAVRKVFQKSSEESTYQDLATGNAKFICVLAECIASCEKEWILKTVKTIQEHVKRENDPTFLIMFLLIWGHLLSTIKDDALKFDVTATVLHDLLLLVGQVTKEEGQYEILQKLDGEVLVVCGDGCGTVPVNLVTNYVYALKKTNNADKLDHVKSRIYLHLLEHAITCLPKPKKHPGQSSVWWTSSGGNNEEPYTKILLAIFEVLLTGLGEGRRFTYQKEFQNCLGTLVKEQFPRKLCLIKFLSFMWTSRARQGSLKGRPNIPVPSAVVVVQSLHIAQLLIKSLDEKAMADVVSNQSQVIPSLIVCLTSPLAAVRRTVLHTISAIIACSPVKTAAAVVLGQILCESSEEIVADEGFIVSVFQRHIPSATKSPSKEERRKSKSKKIALNLASDDVLEYLLNHVVNKEAPSYVARVLLTTLSKVVTKNFLLRCFPSITMILDHHAQHNECLFDHSQFLFLFIQKFTPSTVILLKTEPKVFEMFLQLLSLSRPLFWDHVSPQEALLGQMSAEFFEAMTDEHIQNEVFCKLMDVVMETSDPKMSTKIKDALKLMPISSNHILMQLTKLANEENKKTQKTKRARIADTDDWSSSLSPFWKRVVVIIELLQTKTNIAQPETLLPVLFRILSMCLEFSERSSLDYLMQLVLSTMSKICQTHINREKILTRGVLSEEHFSVEQIIHSIRVSGNPQTHHHALSLLAIAAKLFPERVLHNVMSIFTFMGANVLRQDDSYSFQIIKSTVEAVIPALIQTEKSERNIQKLVVKVLRVFVDAFPHVPEHRRLPVFVHLLTTIGSAPYLHVCLALILEKTSKNYTKEEASGNSKESGLLFCSSLCDEFSPDLQMASLVNLMKYVGSLPEEKPEGQNRKRLADNSGVIFDVNSHSGKELRQFKLCNVELLLNVLGSDNLTENIVQLSAESRSKMKKLYLSMLEEALKYTTSISKLLESCKQETTTKYLRVLSHRVYNIVEKISDHLPGPAFISIVCQLVHNNNATLRRKAMELFNTRMAESSEPFSEQEKGMLLSVLDAIIQLMQSEEETAVNKQSAFYTTIVLSRLLDDKHSLSLKKVLPVAIATFSDKDTKPQVASNALLCLAELCSVLTVHIIPYLPKFIPALLNVVEMTESESRSNVLLLSALTVVHKVIQTLPNFMSSYLRRILILLVSPKFIQLGGGTTGEKSSWKKQITDCAVSLRSDIAVLIKPRILIPNVSQCYDDIVENEDNQESVVALFQLLCECVTQMSKDDVKSYHGQLLPLFTSALDYRSQHSKSVSEDRILKTEEAVIEAFLTLIMRLSESLFRPMFLKLVDWATRSPSTKLRLLVFYHLADRMAEKLKSLFVLFAGYLIKNAASVLDENNMTKTEDVFYAEDYGEKEAVEKSCQLLCNILDCLYKCFLHDNQQFLNKERFDRLLKPLVDQIENQIGGTQLFHVRVTRHLAPCLAQFAVAAGDESYWKTINYHVCLKTRHSSSQVRLAALKVVQELNHRLGEEYLTLLPEIMPFMAELMEDECCEVEQECQQVMSEMENVLGESLQKYL